MRVIFFGSWEGKQSLKPNNSLLEGSFPGMTNVSFLSLIFILFHSHFLLIFLGIVCLRCGYYGYLVILLNLISYKPTLFWLYFNFFGFSYKQLIQGFGPELDV